MLKEINPEYSLEWLMLKLKLQYCGHLIWRANPEKTLMLGKIEGRRRRWQDRMVGWHHWLNGQGLSKYLGDGEGQGSLECCSPWGHEELGWLTEKQQYDSWLPWWLSGRESTCKCKRQEFDPWSGIPWRRKWQPTPVFLPIKCFAMDRGPLGLEELKVT